MELISKSSNLLTLKFILFGDYEENIAFSPTLSDNNQLFYLSNKVLHIVNLDKIEVYKYQTLKFDQTETYKLVETDEENICTNQESNLLYRPYIIDGEKIFYAKYLISSDIPLNEGCISCYNLKSRKTLWKKKLNLGLTMYSLDHPLSLLKTPEGILFTTVKPSLMYLLDTETGKTKWIYNPEKDFGNIGNNITTHSMAEIRKFSFKVIYFFKEGIIANLQYTNEARKFYIEKYLLINWDGKLLRELKEKPLLFFEEKYLCKTSEKGNNKEIIKLICKTITKEMETWKFEYKNYLDEKYQLPYQEKFVKDVNSIYLVTKEKDFYCLHRIDLNSGREIFKKKFKEEIVNIYPLKDEIIVLCKKVTVMSNTDNNCEIVSISKDVSFSINWTIEINKEDKKESFIEENINYVHIKNSKLIIFLNNSYIAIDPSLKVASISRYYQAVEELNIKNPAFEKTLELIKNSEYSELEAFENKEWIILAFHDKVRSIPLRYIIFFKKNL